MAFPTAVNSQITDSITQANTKVLGDAPAMAMGNLYQATHRPWPMQRTTLPPASSRATLPPRRQLQWE